MEQKRLTLQAVAFANLPGREGALAAIQQFERRSGRAADLAAFAELVGALEPRTAERPEATEFVGVVEKTFKVAAADTDPNTGKVIPREEKALSVCSGMDRSLMIEKLRIAPLNRTAREHGYIKYKRATLATFGELCLPFLPLDEPGTFASVEHVLLCPKTGFDIFAVNGDAYSEALFLVYFRGWMAC